MVVLAPHKLFTVDQYHQMAEVGILTMHDRVELIEGEIIQMSPIGRRHALCVDRLTDLFVSTLRPRAMVRVQNPVRLGDHSEPEPDFSILDRQTWLTLTELPEARHIFALVEVSDVTLESDRTLKAPLYARSAIEEFWIVNLRDRVIEVYREPSPKGYQQMQTMGQGERIAFAAFPDLVFTVDELLTDFLSHPPQE